VRLLLDAHALIWAVDEPAKLGSQAAQELQNSANELLLGAGTIWEIAIKVALKKLTLSLSFSQWMQQATNNLGLAILPISVAHAHRQIDLPAHHRDPFDRLLAAQAIEENMTIVSADAVFDQYRAQRLWR